MDDFNAAGLKAFGPTRLRLSRVVGFCTEIMVKYNVPTAYGTFQISGSQATSKKKASIVVKADAWP